MLSNPIELSITLCTGRYVDVILTYAYVVPASYDRDQPKDDFEGYTDIEYIYKQKLNDVEVADLERRLKRYVEGIYSQYINEHKGNKHYKGYIYPEDCL